MSKTIEVVTGNGTEGIKAFAQAIMKLQMLMERFSLFVSQTLNLPDQTETFKLIDKRDEGKPDSFNDVTTALSLIQKPTAIYYSLPYMNLVIINHDGTKVGIRSVDLNHLTMKELIEGLQEKIDPKK